MSALDVALLISARERMEQDIDVTQLLFDITMACNNTCSNMAAPLPSVAESALSLSAFPFVDWPESCHVNVLASPGASAPSTDSSSARPSISPIHSPYGRQCLSRCVQRYVHTHLSTRVKREQVVGRLVAEQREKSRSG